METAQGVLRVGMTSLRSNLIQSDRIINIASPLDHCTKHKNRWKPSVLRGRAKPIDGLLAVTIVVLPIQDAEIVLGFCEALFSGPAKPLLGLCTRSGFGKMATEFVLSLSIAGLGFLKDRVNRGSLVHVILAAARDYQLQFGRDIAG